MNELKMIVLLSELQDRFHYLDWSYSETIQFTAVVNIDDRTEKELIIHLFYEDKFKDTKIELAELRIYYKDRLGTRLIKEYVNTKNKVFDELETWLTELKNLIRKLE
jgi:hypothetical protein